MIEKRFGYILGTEISALKFTETLTLVDKWLEEKANKYICVCNTHSLVTAHNSESFKKVLTESDLCIPDGMPLVFALRKLGFHQQDRVDGPNLMIKLCEISNVKGYKIFLYGGKETSLRRLKNKLLLAYPQIDIVGSISPPFRDLTTEEELNILNEIDSANPDLIFVSLGCPKQEIWMHKNKHKIEGVMIGVGAAFDYFIGDIKRPPHIFQKIGLEWAFRLFAEPKRLFKRYLYNNSAFIWTYLKLYRKDRQNTLSHFR